MDYIFGVRSVLDGVSKYYVQAPRSADIGDIVSFDSDDGEQFAVVELVAYTHSKAYIDMITYIGDTIHPVNTLYGADYRRVTDAAGTP